jgi:hypothetical protein
MVKIFTGYFSPLISGDENRGLKSSPNFRGQNPEVNNVQNLFMSLIN